MRTIALVLLLALVARAEDCPACTAAKECDRHVAADKEALKSLRDGLTKPDPAVRSAAVDAFRAACEAHSNFRPPGNAMALAPALRDPDLENRKKVVAIMGETQDPKTAATILGPELKPILKRLEGDPKNEVEQAAWNGDLAMVDAIAKALSLTKVPEAGAGYVLILNSDRLRVLEIGGKYLPEMRQKDVIPAAIEAIARLQRTAGGEPRNSILGRWYDQWDKLTKCGVPHAAMDKDAAAYLQNIRKWWKDNEKTWK